MTRVALLTPALVCIAAGPAAARDPGEEAYMIRMLACEGPDAKMEIYIPQSIETNDAALARGLARPVIGYYTLDLTEANKGKVLEPVKVSLTADKQTVIVDQYTRKLPAAKPQPMTAFGAGGKTASATAMAGIFVLADAIQATIKSPFSKLPVVH